ANLNPDAHFYELDLRDEKLAEVIIREQPEVINHQAAQIDVRRSVDDPRFDAEVNILGSLNLLEAARTVGVKQVIFASTGGAIYGEQSYFPADEKHPLNPVSPYGIAKLAVEKYLHYYSIVHGIPYTVLRYANVYGPRQNAKGEAGVVAIFCERMLSGQLPVIHGDGQQTRDYVYVVDVMRANSLALEQREQVANEIFNIGTAIETDVNTIFHQLQQCLGSNFPENHGPAKAGEQRRSVLGVQHAQAKLGWQPTTDLATGLRFTADYYRTKT
ncbi:MAG: NAD-dependent epimerase/dehydratase family protein, partial [Acidobacteriota bacterium]